MTETGGRRERVWEREVTQSACSKSACGGDKMMKRNRKLKRRYRKVVAGVRV